MGAIAAIDSAGRAWTSGRHRRRERRSGDVGAVRAGAQPGGRLVVCGGTSGPKAEINLPALFFKQFEIIGSSMGSYQEFADVTRLMASGLAVHVDEVVGLADYPAALDGWKRGSSSARSSCAH